MDRAEGGRHAISAWRSNREVKAETAGRDEKGRVKMERWAGGKDGGGGASE